MVCFRLLSNSSWYFIKLAAFWVLGKSSWEPLTFLAPVLEISHQKYYTFCKSWIPRIPSKILLQIFFETWGVGSSFSGEVKILKLFTLSCGLDSCIRSEEFSLKYYKLTPAYRYPTDASRSPRYKMIQNIPLRLLLGAKRWAWWLGSNCSLVLLMTGDNSIEQWNIINSQMWAGDSFCFGYQSKWLISLHYTHFTLIVLKLSFKYT